MIFEINVTPQYYMCLTCANPINLILNNKIQYISVFRTTKEQLGSKKKKRHFKRHCSLLKSSNSFYISEVSLFFHPVKPILLQWLFYSVSMFLQINPDFFSSFSIYDPQQIKTCRKKINIIHESVSLISIEIYLLLYLAMARSYIL